MEAVIMKSQGVCKVLMGLWSFISLGRGVSIIQAGTIILFMEDIASYFCFMSPSPFPKCDLYCFSEEKMLEGGQTAHCPIKNEIVSFSE